VKKLIVLLAILGVVLLGAAYFVSRPGTNPNGDDGFTLHGAEYGSLTDAVSATGIVQPQDGFAAGSQASGQVVRIYPEAAVEREVKKDQPLLELDRQPAEFKLREAQNSLNEAQENVSRAEDALTSARDAQKIAEEHQRVGGFEHEVLTTKAAVRQAGHAVTLARSQVGKARLAVDAATYALKLTTVRAPGDGVILEQSVVLGQLVGPPASAALFKLARDLKHLEVHAQVAEGDISRIEVGQPAEFTVYAYSDSNTKFKGTVRQVRSMPNNVHGAVYYDTIVTVENDRDPRTKNWMLRPGMTAAVDVVTRRHDNVWKIPLTALSFQLDEHYQTPAARAQLADWPTRHNSSEDWKPVWVLNNEHKPWPVFVRVGGSYASGTYASQTGIRDGQSVEVLEWDPELEVKPKANDAKTYPQLIINAPPVHKPGIFDQPGRFKLS
jgi:HlyD family secretion protein